MDVKSAARQRLEADRKNLIDLSHRIHAHPEPGWQEEKASTWVAEALADAGFSPQRGAYDMPTALVARAGSGPLHLAFCAEYDCLPGIGHACGHNIIAAIGVGAAIAAAKVADEIGLTVTLLGTPAEEVGDAAGKVMMLERGAFEGVHAAMMVHPGPIDVALPPLIAASAFDVFYTGKEAHASAFPELGLNAADALVVAQTAIALLRQHIRHSDRIHGIVTKGGDAPNVIPAHTSARYIVRSKKVEQLDHLFSRVRSCFEAGALATGCKVSIAGGDKPYADMAHDLELATIYQRNAEALGRQFRMPAGDTLSTHAAAGSTDMGNISHTMPAIHPIIGINSLPAVNHQPEFTVHCATQEADQAIFDGALAMVWTAIDAATQPAIRRRLLTSRT
ncbi:MAG TPA: amidohydrolase [Candidatus Binataceae bacterium]|jgi:amidohydrolase|nr:amidohydrolase [Candidatus Binataceae bacterium]